MSYFAVVAVTPTSNDWVSTYGPAAMAIIRRHGGRYVARTTDHLLLEGEGPNPTVLAIVEFPSKADAMDFYEDPDYAPLRASRIKGSISSVYLLEGRDQL